MGSSGGTCCLQVAIPVHLPQKVSGSLGAPLLGVLLVLPIPRRRKKCKGKNPQLCLLEPKEQRCPEQLMGLYAAQDRSANVPVVFHQDE